MSGSGGTGGGVGPTTDSDLANALADLENSYAASPAGIARDLSALGVASVVQTEVETVAVDLCVSSFDPAVVLTWFSQQRVVLTWMIVGPVQRLLDYAGSPQVCSRGASPEEAAAYMAGIRAALPDALPGTDRSQPTDAERVLCEFLGSNAGGEAAKTVLDGLIRAATRGRVDEGEAVALGVQVAGAVCPEALPVARDAFDEYFGSD
ncbi:hypothetical protein [Geodermatophilus obscurus]|uniref:Uncharacterized protein n=1 Tax=Geodermatophilus obscurus (strain ATCC 25078 / DSM 43160 / JCM 3152 / CCUG 61914 / KCC A-0152 / KCTC 9177 / NBRC 13315 / NRRL B-3577 / G-20) TaxID=526225 RepID=D2S8A6_GEOOG|nr:hypothetical protein [Geodermatophilus obscurus]ADB73528.1 hypothetical protein Gobs_0759 [Geodermatophilus obscurus DSM 43160]